MSTEAILSHHLRSLSDSIDEIMANHTPEFVLFAPDGPLPGLEPIRTFFENFLNTSPPELLQALACFGKTSAVKSRTSCGRPIHTSARDGHVCGARWEDRRAELRRACANA